MSCTTSTYYPLARPVPFIASFKLFWEHTSRSSCLIMVLSTCFLLSHSQLISCATCVFLRYIRIASFLLQWYFDIWCQWERKGDSHYFNFLSLCVCDFNMMAEASNHMGANTYKFCPRCYVSCSIFKLHVLFIVHAHLFKAHASELSDKKKLAIKCLLLWSSL